MKRSSFKIFKFIALCFLLPGCVTNVPLPELEHYPEPILNPIPLCIGVYYNDDFRNYESYRPEWRENFQLGKAHIALFDYILPHVFEEVTLIQNFSEINEDMENVDLIIEPNITNFKRVFSQGFWQNEFRVFIGYDISFYSKKSVRLGTWSINAEGLALSAISVNFSSTKDAAQNAMRDLAAQFMTGICKDEETKALFGNYCDK